MDGTTRTKSAGKGSRRPRTSRRRRSSRASWRAGGSRPASWTGASTRRRRRARTSRGSRSACRRRASRRPARSSRAARRRTTRRLPGSDLIGDDEPSGRLMRRIAAPSARIRAGVSHCSLKGSVATSSCARSGRGAMGVVYLARDPQIERELALKTIRFDDAEKSFSADEAKARFLKEAKISGRLQHPHIVTVFDVGEDQGMLYLAMELVQGGSFSQRLADPAGFADPGPRPRRGRGRRGARPRARARRAPPRHQAREHPPVAVALGEGHGLRDRQAPHGRHGAHVHGPDGRVAGLHVARADQGRQARRADGHLLARRRPLPGPHAAQAVPGRHAHDARLPDPPRGAAGPGRRRRRPAGGTRGDRPPVPREGPREPVLDAAELADDLREALGFSPVGSTAGFSESRLKRGRSSPSSPAMPPPASPPAGRPRRSRRTVHGADGARWPSSRPGPPAARRSRRRNPSRPTITTGRRMGELAARRPTAGPRPRPAAKKGPVSRARWAPSRSSPSLAVLGAVVAREEGRRARTTPPAAAAPAASRRRAASRAAAAPAAAPPRPRRPRAGPAVAVVETPAASAAPAASATAAAEEDASEAHPRRRRRPRASRPRRRARSRRPAPQAGRPHGHDPPLPEDQRLAEPGARLPRRELHRDLGRLGRRGRRLAPHVQPRGPAPAPDLLPRAPRPHRGRHRPRRRPRTTRSRSSRTSRRATPDGPTGPEGKLPPAELQDDRRRPLQRRAAGRDGLRERQGAAAPRRSWRRTR